MTVFKADNVHSEVEFMVKHMMVSKVKGTFDNYSVSINADNIEDFENAKVEAKAEVASINTGVSDRDAHLQSGDFFEAETYPEITFESTKIEKSGNSYNVTGNLTIRDITKEETVSLTYNGQGTDPMSGDTVYGFEGNFSLNREEYGLTWNQALETGGVLVSKEVKISLELQFRAA